jgi:hypothetical protein
MIAPRPRTILQRLYQTAMMLLCVGFGLTFLFGIIASVHDKALRTEARSCLTENRPLLESLVAQARAGRRDAIGRLNLQPFEEGLAQCHLHGWFFGDEARDALNESNYYLDGAWDPIASKLKNPDVPIVALAFLWAIPIAAFAGLARWLKWLVGPDSGNASRPVGGACAPLAGEGAVDAIISTSAANSASTLSPNDAELARLKKEVDDAQARYELAREAGTKR